jgi:hypothetical protein
MMNGTPKELDLGAISALRAQLWDAGYRSLAVYSHDHADRVRAGKAPIGDRWTERARKDPPECVELPAVAWAANTGILCDGLRAIDIDVDDPELAGAVRALAIDMLGDTLMRCRRCARSGDRHARRHAHALPGEQRPLPGTLPCGRR